MPRKSTGSTIRSKKTAATEPAALQPVPLATPVAGSKNGVNHGANMDEEIRNRAYELYLERHGQAGDPNRDWLVAEREVRARHATAGQSA